MSARGLALLRELHAHGDIRWNPESGTFWLSGAALASPELRAVVLEEWDTVALVLARATAWVIRLREGGTPFVGDDLVPPGECADCGEAVGEGERRCPPCALAGEIALAAPG